MTIRAQVHAETSSIRCVIRLCFYHEGEDHGEDTSFEGAVVFDKDNTTWGWPPAFEMAALNARSLNFRKKANDQDFPIRARLNVRFVNEDDWKKYGPRMKEDPESFLFIDPMPDAAYPDPPPSGLSSTPLKDMMLKMLAEADEKDGGVFAWIVGPERVRILAHKCVVSAALPGVAFLRDGMKEGATKEVELPHICPTVFAVFIKYLYTQIVAPFDMHRHAAGLLMLAKQYLCDALVYKCEYYLCRMVQVCAAWYP